MSLTPKYCEAVQCVGKPFEKVYFTVLKVDSLIMFALPSLKLDSFIVQVVNYLTSKQIVQIISKKNNKSLKTFSSSSLKLNSFIV